MHDRGKTGRLGSIATCTEGTDLLMDTLSNTDVSQPDT